MPNARLAIVCGLTYWSLGTAASYANNVQGAVVTRSEGDAQIMIKQSTLSTAPPSGVKSIIFEKESYFIRPVKPGDRPANGDVVTTGKDGKIRLIYRNGDQVTVTPGTAYKFSWDPKTDRNAIAEIIYGDIRAVIQPDGPRSGMKVKTKSAVLGVRGTDFYVSSWSKDAGSKVTVMRGSVMLAPRISDPTATAPSTSTLQLQEVLVPAGSSGTVIQKVMAPAENLALTTPSSPPSTPTVAVELTSKQELIVIQSDSKVTKPKVDELLKTADAGTKDKLKEISLLEATSVESTLKDVKRYDPELFKKIQEEAKKTKKTLDSDHVQAEAVKKIFITAPSLEKAVNKPTLDDLENGGDIYDKYKWHKNE
jgi:hypothetical protein